MIIDCSGAKESHASGSGDFPGLHVQVIENLHMIPNKADGRKQDVLETFLG